MSKTINALKRAAATTRALDDGAADALRSVVEAVATFHKDNGYAPSLVDLAACLGWTRERTRDAVRALSETGHLTARPGVGHSLRVASDVERMNARAGAWYAALRDLPAIEVAAARAALDKLQGAT
jgi:hypothetical protein